MVIRFNERKALRAFCIPKIIIDIQRSYSVRTMPKFVIRHSLPIKSYRFEASFCDAAWSPSEVLGMQHWVGVNNESPKHHMISHNPFLDQL